MALGSRGERGEGTVKCEEGTSGHCILYLASLYYAVAVVKLSAFFAWETINCPTIAEMFSEYRKNRN